MELDDRMADIASNLFNLDDDEKYRTQFHIRPDDIYGPVRNLDFPRMATEVWAEERIRGYACVRAPLAPARQQVAKRLADELWCARPDWIAASRVLSEKYATSNALPV